MQVTPGASAEAPPVSREQLFRCQKCLVMYPWVKSTSWLKMTYCGILCEIGGLGFSLASIQDVTVHRAGCDCKHCVKTVTPEGREPAAAAVATPEGPDKRDLVHA